MIYFMENARQILSKEQILEYVWDVDGQFVFISIIIGRLTLFDIRNPASHMRSVFSE